MVLPKAVPSQGDTPTISIRDRSRCPAVSANIFPGARDVDTPYGVMRVYEWDSVGGRKVLLVHDETTPGPLLGSRVMIIAQRLQIYAHRCAYQLNLLSTLHHD